MASQTTVKSAGEYSDAYRPSVLFQTTDNAETNSARIPKLYGAMEPPREKGAGRVVPMGVLNLSMPRTGTMSMQAALDILGYRCYHSTDTWKRISDVPQWNRAQDAKFFGIGKQFTRDDWDHLLGEYSAVSADPPAIAFAEELVETYPESKVILVDRDVNKWYESISKSLTPAMYSPMLIRLSKWDPQYMGALYNMHERWTRGWMGAHTQAEMDAVSKDVYRNHMALVRRVTPKDRLLEYKLGDGWEPLCRFLGKDIPDCPFPEVNDSAALTEQLAIIAKRGLWKAAQRIGSYLIISITVSVAGWWYWQNS